MSGSRVINSTNWDNPFAKVVCSPPRVVGGAWSRPTGEVRIKIAKYHDLNRGDLWEHIVESRLHMLHELIRYCITTVTLVQLCIDSETIARVNTESDIWQIPTFKIGKTTEAYVLPYKHSDLDMSHKIMFFFVAGVLEAVLLCRAIWVSDKNNKDSRAVSRWWWTAFGLECKCRSCKNPR